VTSSHPLTNSSSPNAYNRKEVTSADKMIDALENDVLLNADAPQM